jgi:hypothetical protein
MLKNKPIKNNTDTIGFLLIITNIPHKIAINDIIYKISPLYPLVKVSFIRNKVPIKIISLDTLLYFKPENTLIITYNDIVI